MRDRRSLLHLPLNILRTTLLLGTGGIAIVLILSLMNIGQFSLRWLQGIDDWFKVEEQEPEVESPTLIVQKIRGVSELTTTVFAMETVVPASQTNQIGNLVIGESRLLYVAYGEVRAGIDLSQLSAEAIQNEGDRLVVTLPEPEILDKKIDVERSRIYDYDRGFLNLGPDKIPELLEFAQRETLNNIVLNACENGILRQANDQAEVALSRLLGDTGFGSVEIQTTKPAMCNGDSSET
ncbi:hypothetical protein Lepto7376_4084 [[Leptolyngbya] sp. PCC 7376]|uniref:DUF4230 domain-containing protein n=1 Tax=[Leptolyngbya] sp. PCC 7376 TaxID=111781 RepID=UPI00029F25A4|nr:DUF4230 domain-containing protein [[Leptolyngbya] sp. PCC 7376]AFY40213.1 hypothetical protein Lepto7376_4084 [[Leptolyngbya] sp. PCC 7376]